MDSTSTVVLFVLLILEGIRLVLFYLTMLHPDEVEVLHSLVMVFYL